MQGDPTTAGAAAMRPLADWPQPARHGIRGVMTDIDDTLTADGHIVPAALHALHALHAHGYRLIAITAPYALCHHDPWELLDLSDPDDNRTMIERDWGISSRS